MGKTIKIVNAARAEGLLYRAQAEDGEIVVFDCGVTVLGEDGVVYSHDRFVVLGAVQVPDEGYSVPNRNYRAQVQAFIDKVQARGYIDLRYWSPVPALPSPEEREAYNLRCEAEERAWAHT